MSSAFRGALAAGVAAVAGQNFAHNPARLEEAEAQDNRNSFVEARKKRGSPCRFMRRKGACLLRKLRSITGAVKSAVLSGFRNVRNHFDKSPSAGLVRLARRRDIVFRHLIPQMAKNNIDINCANRKGETVLISAVMGGNHPTVCDALSMGADKSLVDKEGRTACWYAADRGDSRALGLLLETNPEGQPENKSFINQQDKNGQTALHRAVERKATDIVKQLIAAGASPWIKDNKGTWPLLKAMSVSATADVLRSLGLFVEERGLVVDRNDKFFEQSLAECVSTDSTWDYVEVKEGSSLSQTIQECLEKLKKADVHQKACEDWRGGKGSDTADCPLSDSPSIYPSNLQR